MGALVELTGRRFGRLVVLRKVQVEGARNAMWECRCDCGSLTVGAGANLGKSKLSCGCMQSENGSRTLEANRLARDHLHGESKSHEFKSWAAMKGRCLNPNNAKYPRYGGRGIKICERWVNSFENFLADMGRRPSKLHSIDRIDNDGNYEPSNCHWATVTTQTRNRSTTRYATIAGVRLCIRDWAARLGVNRKAIYDLCRETYSNGSQNLQREASPELAVLRLYREKIDPNATLTE